MTKRASRETQSRVDAREIRRSTTVLLASDDQVALAPLRTTFEKAGHRVVAAEDGTGAIAATATERPDLVVVDLFLPDVEAFTFLRDLATHDYRGPVVALVPSQDLSDMLQREFRDVRCVAKRSSLSQISAAVESALAGRDGNQP